jgi:hypothetical protein
VGRKNYSASRILYPEEKEGKIKDANKELRSQNKQLKKKIRQLEEENRSLKRAFNKSTDYIEQKIKHKSIERVIDIVNDFDYKETERGRERVAKQKENRIFMSQKCPECGKVESEGFNTFEYIKFVVHTCKCGFRTKVNKSEGNERG